MHRSDNGGDIYTVFTRDDLLTHATIYWTGNAIASSIRTYANNNGYSCAPSHDRTPVIEAPTGITFVDYENPPGINSSKERIESFLTSDRAAWYKHINIAAHPNGDHFIPWEIPEQWTTDLVQTFKSRLAPQDHFAAEVRPSGGGPGARRPPPMPRASRHQQDSVNFATVRVTGTPLYGLPGAGS